MPPEAFDYSLGAYYRLQHQIGAGAFGEVWQAVDVRTDELVAAKLLHSHHFDDAQVVSRFVFERSVLVKLRHPAVVSVRDMVIDGDRIAIVMELVPNGSLRNVLRERRTLPPQLAVDVAASVLDGLAVAHELGIVHRDIKPDNVLLSPSWWSVRPGDIKLVDFGIARIVAEGQSGSTAGMGTPNYMAPEVIDRGEARSPADVYAAGIMLYELIAGRTPFGEPGAVGFAIARRQVDKQPPRLPVPEPLELVLLRLLAKEPADRPTAVEAAQALRAVRDGLADLRALPPQSPPSAEDYLSAQPATIVRGIRSLEAPLEEGQHTVHRPARAGYADLPDAPLTTDPPSDPGASGSGRWSGPPTPPAVGPSGPSGPTDRRARRTTPAWRDVRVIGGAVAAVVLVAAGTFVLTGGGDDEPSARPSGGTTTSTTQAPISGTFDAQQTDDPLPSGLTTSRSAVYDGATGLVTLTITYRAQTAPLSGPFLEVIDSVTPAASPSECPPVSWTSGEQDVNVPTETGVGRRCGYSISTTVKAQQRAEVTATFPLDLGADPETALQAWLDASAADTLEAVTDPELVNRDSYPVQRIVDIVVEAPSRTVPGRDLRIVVLPKWAGGGEDVVNPILDTGEAGAASGMLTALAGTEDPVRFVDECNGALRVVGTTVRTLYRSQAGCRIGVSIGTFTNRRSNPITITGFGG